MAADWAAVERAVLDRLDLRAELTSLGVEFAQDEPTAGGWLACHALDRDDDHASAAFNVGDGAARGRYRDMGGAGASGSLWEAVAVLMGKFDGDWRKARGYFAARAGVALPAATAAGKGGKGGARAGKGTKDRPVDSLAFLPVQTTPRNLAEWAAVKGGFDAAAALAAAGRYARWPATAPAELAQYVAAFPAWTGPEWLDGEPCAWVIARLDGQPVEVFDGADNAPRRSKTLSVRGSRGGLLGHAALARLCPRPDFGAGGGTVAVPPPAPPAAVWKVEGLTDLLALTAAVRAAGLADTHLVISNSQGCQERPKASWLALLGGVPVYVVGDADDPGVSGAYKWCRDLQAERAATGDAAPVKHVKLPYAVQPNHGPDLRDFLKSGDYAALLGLAAATPAFAPDDALDAAYKWHPRRQDEDGETGAAPDGGAVATPKKPRRQKAAAAADADAALPGSAGDGLEMDFATLMTPAEAATAAAPALSPLAAEAATAGGAGGAASAGAGGAPPNDARLLRRRQFDETILQRLGLQVLGRHGNGAIDVFCRHKGRVENIPNIDHWSFRKLLMLVGPLAHLHVTDSREQVQGMAAFEEVRQAVAALSSDTALDRVESLGQGIWPAPANLSGQTVIVNGREGLLWNGHDLTVLGTPHVAAGQVLDYSGGEPWVERDQLRDYLMRAGNRAWATKVIEETAALFGNWNWNHKSDPLLMALLTACTFIQTTIRWRPEVFISGASDAGKTTAMTVLRDLFGGLEMYCQKSSEPGVRQSLKNTARAILIDEFESDGHRQRLLDYFRTTSHGSGRVLRGTSDQRGQSFILRHIPWMAAIENGLTRTADRNRFILFDLLPLKKALRGTWVPPPPGDLRELGLRLCAVAIRYGHGMGSVYQKMRELPGVDFKGVPARVVDSYRTPVSLWARIAGLDAAAAMPTLVDCLGCRPAIERQQNNDEEDLIRAILGSTVKLGGGHDSVVSAVLTDPVLYATHCAALEGFGITLTANRAGPRTLLLSDKQWLFVNPDQVKRHLLQHTHWRDLDLAQLIGRVNGVQYVQRRLAGQRMRGFEIPLRHWLELAGDGTGDGPGDDGLLPFLPGETPEPDDAAAPAPGAEAAPTPAADRPAYAGGDRGSDVGSGGVTEAGADASAAADADAAARQLLADLEAGPAGGQP